MVIVKSIGRSQFIYLQKLVFQIKCNIMPLSCEVDTSKIDAEVTETEELLKERIQILNEGSFEKPSKPEQLDDLYIFKLSLYNADKQTVKGV